MTKLKAMFLSVIYSSAFALAVVVALKAAGGGDPKRF